MLIFFLKNDIGPLQSQMWTPPAQDEHETEPNNMELFMDWMDQNPIDDLFL